MSDEDKEKFYDKFQFDPSMSAKDIDAAYDEIEKEFIDREDLTQPGQENLDTNMG